MFIFIFVLSFVEIVFPLLVLDIAHLHSYFMDMIHYVHLLFELERHWEIREHIVIGKDDSPIR